MMPTSVLLKRQVPVPEHPPDQPTNTLPGDGVACSTTPPAGWLFTPKSSLQVPVTPDEETVQSIGLCTVFDMTRPWPLPPPLSTRNPGALTVATSVSGPLGMVPVHTRLSPHVKGARLMSVETPPGPFCQRSMARLPTGNCVVQAPVAPLAPPTLQPMLGVPRKSNELSPSSLTLPTPPPTIVKAARVGMKDTLRAGAGLFVT